MELIKGAIKFADMQLYDIEDNSKPVLPAVQEVALNIVGVKRRRSGTATWTVLDWNESRTSIT